MPATTSRDSTCWLRCDCAPTCRASTPSRRRWAATRASSSWSRRRAGWHDSATWPGNCCKPKAALYLFPRLDPNRYPIADDQQFILELLLEEKVLLVQGTGFNWPSPDHFRVVFLPNVDDLREAIGRIARFLEHYSKRHGA